MRFKIFGTEIYVSFLFAAVIAFMLATDRTGLVIPTLFASFIHEFGHLFAMWVSKSQPKAIRLIPASVQIVRDFATKPTAETAIAICGPAANAAVAATLFLNYSFYKNDGVFTFALLNAIICLFNLLPVSGLDGGTILTAALSRRMDIFKAEGIVRIITALLAAFAFVGGVYIWCSGKFNLSIFIVALYLAVSAMIKT